MRVLIVDDEPELYAQIALTLRKQQYTVETAGDGDAALEKICTDPYDMIVLDIMLPEKDGFTVLRELRAEGVTTPVLMLTAKGEVANRVKGLDLGADDYLHKPFSMAELLARIRAFLRRSHEQASPLLVIGTIRLDTNTRSVTLNNEPITLTPKEFSVLEFLLYNRNRKDILAKERRLVRKAQYADDRGGDIDLTDRAGHLPGLQMTGGHEQ